MVITLNAHFVLIVCYLITQRESHNKTRYFTQWIDVNDSFCKLPLDHMCSNDRGTWLSSIQKYKMESHKPFRDEYDPPSALDFAVIPHCRWLPCSSPPSDGSYHPVLSDKNQMSWGARPWPYTAEDSLKIKTPVNVAESTGSDGVWRRECWWGNRRG